ncbi:ricin-type beta-trefoil lectin domain protein [Streptomyces sp. TLI_146]|uniref:ricin-type beta-trefoil lectin domain protein n=1 Tax=Streptomyces sp. TLI_146 TaxID=1938858 RepID=UPI000C706BF2|nr:ricin-type beta-trefoil lectin domain protein [Streptomyces sp. TLI_146]PKV82580.1 ricin-type beta-trefoil lectin protein [Streptomyces sp. TLI_146]
MAPYACMAAPGRGKVPPRGFRVFTYGLRAVLGGVLACALILTALVAQAPRAEAAVSSFTPLTWNMQGGGGGDQSKWTSVGALSAGGPGRRKHTVIALQEAGPSTSLPSGATATGRTWAGPVVPAGSQDPNRPLPAGTTYTVTEYQWQVGSASRGVSAYLYFMQTDFSTSSRVNLAMVTHTRATNVHFVAPQNDNRAPQPRQARRPSFGVQLDAQTVFWNVHAGSYGPNAYNDADNLLTAIATTSRAAGLTEWSALGDFNRNPTQLRALPAGTVVYRTNTGTQQGGGELDYMVSNGANLNGWSGRALGGGVSDHFPVEFFLRASADRPEHDTPLRTGVDPDHCLQAAASSSVTTLPCTGASNQNWEYVPAATGNSGTVRSGTQCLDVSGGGKTSGTTVLSWPCNGGVNQTWQLREDGTVYNPNSSRCLDSTAAKTFGKPVNTLVINDCDTTAYPLGQQFIGLSDPPQHEVTVTTSGSVSVSRTNSVGEPDETLNLGGNMKAITMVEEPGVLHLYGVNASTGFVASGDLDITTSKFSGWSDLPGAPPNPTSITALARRGTIYLLVQQQNLYPLLTFRRPGEQWQPFLAFESDHATQAAMIVVPGRADELNNTVVNDRLHVFTLGTDGRVHDYQGDITVDTNGRQTPVFASDFFLVPGGTTAKATSLTVNLSGNSLTLEIADSDNNVYTQALNTDNSVWNPDWAQIPGLHVRNVTSETAPGQLRVCGTTSDNHAECAEEDTSSGSNGWKIALGVGGGVLLVAGVLALLWFLAPAAIPAALGIAGAVLRGARTFLSKTKYHQL